MATVDAKSILAALHSLCNTLAQQSSTSADNYAKQFQAKLPHLFNSSDAKQENHDEAQQQLIGHINRAIDHTLLKAEASNEEIRELCAQALEHKFYSVCVNGYNAKQCVQLINSDESAEKPLVCCVIGFPLGANTTRVKAFEAEDCISAGAEEIDMVINIGALRSGQYLHVYEDIHAVARAVKAANSKRKLKVILETALLADNDLIIWGCLLSALAGADFVKTSTGFNSAGGASLAHVFLMKAVVGNSLEVKASGGVRDIAGAKAMIQGGATRLGTSNGIAIMKGSAASAAY
jgi:deoxyribose-phosphate aldolase